MDIQNFDDTEPIESTNTVDQMNMSIVENIAGDNEESSMNISICEELKPLNHDSGTIDQSDNINNFSLSNEQIMNLLRDAKEANEFSLVITLIINYNYKFNLNLLNFNNLF